MIIIQNCSRREHNVPYGKGLQYYQLFINNKLICEFKHTFEEGLAECLRKAAAEIDLIELAQHVVHTEKEKGGT